MKEQEFWESYKAFASQLAAELPNSVAPFGEFIVTWSPFVMLIVVVSKLIDLLFKSASIKLITKGFVKLCGWMWSEAHKDPEHKGLITEASIPTQRAFHKISAWVQGILGGFVILYALLVLAALLFLDIKEGLVIEGSLVLFTLSAACIFIGFIQLGLCHQSIKLAKSLSSN